MSVLQMTLLALLVFFTAVISIRAYLVLRQRRTPAINRHLAAGLGLRRRERRDLAVVAGTAGLLEPTAMLISRGCFDATIDRVPPEDRPASVVGLRQRLFES